MAVQSEAALENALIHALEQMSYEYVKIEEESNLRDNFKCQLEKHNRNQPGTTEKDGTKENTGADTG